MTKSRVDRYDIEARYVPALVGSVPFLFFGYYFINGVDGAFWQSAFALAIGTIGLSTALYLIAIHFCRTVGKVIEEYWFRRGLAFPTTEFLLDNDTSLTPSRRADIRRKIKQQFNIDLGDALEGTDANRRLIHEAVGQIRTLFYRKNHLVQQRNIQFGMTRNLLAGSLIAIAVSSAGLLLSSWIGNDAASAVALTLLIMYILLAIASAALLKFVAQQYAHTLFNEYMANR
jgi:hypothetical protein